MREGLVSTKRRDGSPNIRAVILDYGQVLARCPTVPEFGRMAKMFNVSFESFYQLWEDSRGTYDRGDFTAEEYWLKLAVQTNTALDGGQIEILRQVEVNTIHRNFKPIPKLGVPQAVALVTRSSG